ncbi:RagB/SusD family nutrient uptake outer membrane protein, partial [Bacteroidales bacterium OttesenSCG-928-L03]|nr:RagB/SusD family nutrient uptake outer membrane protein [Bacteroidales bacterium OttesenSCG-928-L03]
MKKIIYILIVACGMSMTSCNDWLDVLPKNEQVTADYWKTKEDVEAVLASGYVYMRQTTPRLIEWGELRGASIYPYASSGARAKLHNFQLTGTEDECKWSKFYEVINMANSVLDYAPGVARIDDTYPEAAMKSHLTEAYFMRSLMYFYLVRNFQEVPLILTSYVDDSTPYSMAKSSEATIIAQIKSDIIAALTTEAAKEFFDHDNWNGASKGRATKWALYALMADVCLWSEDYDECIKYANLLIGATSAKRPVFMSIPEQWLTIYNPGNSNESIFEMNWDGSVFGQTTNSPTKYFPMGVINLLFSPAMGERLLTEDMTEVQVGKESVRGSLGTYANLIESSDGIMYNVWKYVATEIRDIAAIRTTDDANYIIYRMADVMLMKAEALIWKGGLESWQQAVDIINQIRERSNLIPLDLILAEENELSLLNYVL